MGGIQGDFSLICGDKEAILKKTDVRKKKTVPILVIDSVELTIDEKHKVVVKIGSSTRLLLATASIIIVQKKLLHHVL